MRYRETKIQQASGVDVNLTRIFKYNMMRSIMFSSKPIGKKVKKIPAIWAINEDPDEFSCGNEKNTFNERIKKFSRFLLDLRNTLETQLKQHILS